MNAQEIESLLRKARPPELPPGWKWQILGPLTRPKSQPVFLRLSWSALATCWTLILLLHLSTPDVPQGTVPFDYVAFLALRAAQDRIVTANELDPPAIEPLHIETIFRLPAPQTTPVAPQT